MSNAATRTNLQNAISHYSLIARTSNVRGGQEFALRMVRELTARLAALG